jgi:SAM-dependent methyltransferase
MSNSLLVEKLNQNTSLLNDSMVFLHELRTHELRNVPGDAATVLSAGCSTIYYFEWFSSNYPAVKRHIGVEAYLPKPASLPADVEWVASSVASIEPVTDSSVDLVFAGQVIEHLWPDEIAGFLCEARRVLKSGGHLVLDSPNRRVTEALNWHMPEHTVEFTVDEAVLLLQLAGFKDIRAKGVWLCYDRDQHCFLPLPPLENAAGWTWQQRLGVSATRPEDCFVWWIEATNSELPVKKEQIMQQASRICDRFQTHRRKQLYHTTGQVNHIGNQILVTGSRGEAGFLIYGPYVPLRSGNHRITFSIRNDETTVSTDGLPLEACVIDCYESVSQRVLASRKILAGEIS